tara:strand:- start:49 stop:522 length:474 start_codon:yes stop_codon:yes gene_type:complete
MNIECINCSKTFKVNSDLIPSEGRNLQCGSCNHIWFFNIKDQIKPRKDIQKEQESFSLFQEKEIELPISRKSREIINNKEVDKNKRSIENRKKTKPKFRLSHFLSYILVLIVSFIALIIVVDTFKSLIFDIFPYLELIYYNLFETLKDISLFIKDLT